MVIAEPSYSSVPPAVYYANLKFIWVFFAVGPGYCKGALALSGRIHERTELPPEIVHEAVASIWALTAWIGFVRLLKVTRE